MTFKKLLNELRLADKNGDVERLEALCHQVWARALAGDMSAIKWIFTQLEGPPKSRRSVTNAEEDEIRYIS